jgi:hypothetical protein
LSHQRRFEAQSGGSVSLTQALELSGRLLAFLDFRRKDAPDVIVFENQPFHFRRSTSEILAR